MADQKTILILTSNTGGGHLSLAEALRDLLEHDREDDGVLRIGARTIIADPQPRYIQRHYRFVSRHARWLWAAEYQALDGPRRAALAHRVFSSVVEKGIQDLLDATRPDLIISTYPFLTMEVSQAQAPRASKVPLALLLSDANELHATWLSEQRASAVLAPTRETFEQALGAGFPPARVYASGWPVRASFVRAAQYNRAKQQAIRVRLGLDPDRFTLFLQGGAEGAARLAWTLQNMLDTPTLSNNLQIILATGAHHALLERFTGTPHVVCLPYMHDIAGVMVAADVVMGKAGPNTLFEAMTLGKPFIATAYIPGQERANLSFIARHRLGWVALEPEAQRALLLALMTQPSRLSAISSTIHAYRDWNTQGAERIVPLVHELLSATG